MRISPPPRRGNSSGSRGRKDRRCNVSTVRLMGNLVIKPLASLFIPITSLLFVLHQTLSHHFIDTYGGHEFRQYIVLKKLKGSGLEKKKKAKKSKD